MDDMDGTYLSRRTLVQGGAASLFAASLPMGMARANPPLDGGAPTLLTGLDRLLGDQAHRLAGKRIALLTHAAGVDRTGVRGIDRLAALPDTRLSMILSPEHGLNSRAAAGEHVDSGRDGATGLPVHSLYGASREPDPALFTEVDTIIVDLQDCGARPFTYSSTLAAVLRVAAQAGTQVIVADRPNPLGGVTMEGPMLDPALASFVGAHDVPLRHGLTFGELAQMINAEAGIGAMLDIVPMMGWRREDGFAPFMENRLPFVPPSPNLRSPSAMLTYPGTVLIEGTNVSEGRGSDRPFETIGAPFIKGEALAEALTQAGLGGADFDPVEFIPTTSKFAGRPCEGVSLWASDNADFLPVRTGLTILGTLLRLYPAEVQFLPGARPFFDLLIGQSWVRPALLAGTPVSAIEARWQPALTAFAERRRPFLLY
jgi:uncharacterized protein YbbC (DUF1343 family)